MSESQQSGWKQANGFMKIELDNIKPFAKGGTGECYRLSDDIILKLYYEDMPVKNIVNEKLGARSAFVAGVPTAISFMMVEVGNRKGVLYEMVQGKTLSELVEAEPSRAFELGGMLAEIGKTLHTAEVKADLPKATVPYRNALSMADYAPEATVRRISEFMDRIDKEIHYVHGDFQSNNIIISPNGPMLLDMGDFSIGSPLLDISNLYFNLFESPEALAEGRNTFNRMTHEEALAFWRGFEHSYFEGGKMHTQTKELLHKVKAIRKMGFERLYGLRLGGEQYCENIRQEVLTTFGE